MNWLYCFCLQVVKYGVIEIKDLVDDLIKWKWLYISGRLHKPVSQVFMSISNICVCKRGMLYVNMCCVTAAYCELKVAGKCLL